MYPDDAISVPITIADGGGTDCPTLLAASTTPRTLLSTYVSSKGDDSFTMSVGSVVIRDNLMNQTNNQQIFISYPFTNKAITCTRANNKPFQVQLTYVNYNVATDPPQEHIIIDGGATTEKITTDSSDFDIIHSFTFGEITSACLLIVVAAILSLRAVHAIFRKPVRYHK